MWSKLGLIFAPDTSLSWSRSHASAPAAFILEGSRARVFFACRDSKNRSHIGWFDTDLYEPGSVLNQAKEPALAPGPLGTFDDHGIYASSVLRDGDRVLIYTIGWNPGVRAPLFYSSIGLAASHDNAETFERVSPAPIMARSEHDPCLVTAPVVLKEGDLWRMWYVSGIRWERDPVGGSLHSVYHIKYAESDDGVAWRRNGRVCLGSDDDKERNISRFCVVLQPGGGYEAWYASDRGEGYRLGRAVSEDGLTWQRTSVPAELLEPTGDWESQAMAYPWVIRHKGRQFMFYNGNAFGRDGIGMAVRHEN